MLLLKLAFRNITHAGMRTFGGPETLVCNPATSTHASLTPDEQAACGVTAGLLRMSVGLEDCADLVADVEQALETPA